MTESKSTTAFKVEDIKGRGKGVIAARDIKGGEVIVEDAPAVLVVHSQFSLQCCSYCFRLSEKQLPLTCEGCKQAAFCGNACKAECKDHLEVYCKALATLAGAGMDSEKETQCRAMVRIAILRTANTKDWKAITELNSAGLSLSKEEKQLCGELHEQVVKCLGKDASPDLQTVEDLFLKDKSNGFAIAAMDSPKGDKQARAYGLYPQASRFNHDCLPSAVRFDDFDSRPVDVRTRSVGISIRALQDIKAGSEICISYVPLGFQYKMRQQRLVEEYNFTCSCARCREEASWSDDEDEAYGDDGDDDIVIDDEKTFGQAGKAAAAAAAAGGAGAAGLGLSSGENKGEGKAPSFDFRQMSLGGSSGGGTRSSVVSKPSSGLDSEGAPPVPHGDFMLRHLCMEQYCGGTMAPILGDKDKSMECNTCGRRRTEEAFQDELARNDEEEEDGFPEGGEGDLDDGDD